MLKIGEFSRLCTITVRMLRHYDEIGLLIPAYIDEVTNYRHYSSTQLIVANKIQFYKSLGFPLLTIKEILASRDDKQTIASYFKIRKVELKEEESRLVKQIANFNEAYEQVDSDSDSLKYNVVLKTIPQRNVVSIRKRIRNFSHEQDLWKQLYQELEKRDVRLLADGYSITLYHDDEFQEEDMEIEVQVSVKGDYKDTETVKFFQTDEVEVASVVFSGSYDQMPFISQRIGSWLEANLFEISGAMINIFHVAPSTSNTQEDWVTEACYVVKKRDI